MASKELRKLDKAMNGAISKLCIILSEEVTHNLIDATPVDTGFAETNWIPSIAVPYKGTASTYEKALNGSTDNGPQRRGLFQLRLGYNVTKGPIYIVNNVDYISLLNMGYSAQAPSGYVQTAIVQSIVGLNGRRI